MESQSVRYAYMCLCFRPPYKISRKEGWPRICSVPFTGVSQLKLRFHLCAQAPHMPCVPSGVGRPEPRFCLPKAKSRAATRIIWGPMGATNVGRAWPNAREFWGDGRSTGGFLAVPTRKIIFHSRYCLQLFPFLLVGLRCTWNSSIAKF